MQLHRRARQVPSADFDALLDSAPGDRICLRGSLIWRSQHLAWLHDAASLSNDAEVISFRHVGRQRPGLGCLSN